MFAALKGLNMTAQGNALGTENGHESKPCKGEIGKVGGAAIGRDLLHSLCRSCRAWIDERSRDPGRCPGLSYLALSGLGRADHPHYDPLLQTAEELPFGKHGAPAATVWTNNLASATEDSHTPRRPKSRRDGSQ